MSAVFTSLIALVRAGAPGGAARALFGSSHNKNPARLPRDRVEPAIVDGTAQNHWEKALSKPTQIVIRETPSNRSRAVRSPYARHRRKRSARPA
jgi:O-succinylhomoserine sulfhydrylase